MDDLQTQMNAILNDPKAMETIMSLAKNLGQPQEHANKQPSTTGSSMPDIDIGMLQRLSGFAKQSGIDNNQKSLLQALRPYLSADRVAKLERAMRAAKLARVATGLLGAQSGR